MKAVFVRGMIAFAMAGMISTAAIAQDDPVVIGAVSPNTGGMAVLGNDLTNWYRMAVDHQNAEGGVLGRQIELAVGDATTAQEAIAAVERLVGREGADAVVGTIASFISQAASEAALSSNVLYWETGSLARGLTERGLLNYVRSGPNTVNFARTSADAVIGLVAPELGVTPEEVRIWVEHEDSNYGSSIAEEQERVLLEAGATVDSSGHSSQAVDLTDSVLRAAEFDPDVWILSGYVADTHLLLRTAREQGFAPDAIIIVGLGDSQETIDALGLDYLQGILIVTYPRQEVNPSYAPGADELSAEYVERYGQQPVGNSGFGGYVGLRILFDAIEAAGSTDFEAVVEAARGIEMEVGTMPNGYGVRFDETMQNTRANAIVYQWQGDHTVAVYPDVARREGAELADLARP
jgi:branched-chain amino acid transport system substrate-binding protein